MAEFTTVALVVQLAPFRSELLLVLRRYPGVPFPGVLGPVFDLETPWRLDRESNAAPKCVRMRLVSKSVNGRIKVHTAPRQSGVRAHRHKKTSPRTSRTRALALTFDAGFTGGGDKVLWDVHAAVAHCGLRRCQGEGTRMTLSG